MSPELVREFIEFCRKRDAAENFQGIFEQAENGEGVVRLC